MDPPTDPGRFAADLRDIVGPAHVLTAPDERAAYERDWTARHDHPAELVVRPGTTAEVAAIVRCCAAHDRRIVPQGGNTGLVGGSVPHDHEVVVSTRRLQDLEPVDRASSQVTAGAGVTIGALQRHARAAGLDFAVDFAARDSATVGGGIATDAGGSRVVRFGTFRRQLAGIEAVTADGAVIGSLAGLPKETVGPNLAAALAGSEGTLALITRARLHLVPRFDFRCTTLAVLPSLADAVALLAHLRADVHNLDLCEVLFPTGVALVREHTGATLPLHTDTGVYVLLECADHHDPAPALAAVMAEHTDPDAVAVAGAPSQREAMLRVRDELPAALTPRGIPLKLDVAVPVGRLAAFHEEASSIAAVTGADLVTFGHLAEGNLHLNLLTEPGSWDSLSEQILTAAVAHGGTISAEHGVGADKARWLPLVRSTAERALATAVRRAWDPAGRLNPAVLAEPTAPPAR